MKKKLNISQIGSFKPEELCVGTGIGFYTMRRILKGEREVTKTEQIAFCEVTGIRAEDLFVEVEDDKQAS